MKPQPWMLWALGAVLLYLATRKAAAKPSNPSEMPYNYLEESPYLNQTPGPWL